jgi:hypothetical protein
MVTVKKRASASGATQSSFWLLSIVHADISYYGCAAIGLDISSTRQPGRNCQDALAEISAQSQKSKGRHKCFPSQGDLEKQS